MIDNEKKLTLSDIQVGQTGRVIGYLSGEKIYRHKLLTMGLTPGTQFRVTRIAPLGDPIELDLRDYSLSLRRQEAQCLLVEKE